MSATNDEKICIASSSKGSLLLILCCQFFSYTQVFQINVNICATVTNVIIKRSFYIQYVSVEMGITILAVGPHITYSDTKNNVM